MEIYRFDQTGIESLSVGCESTQNGIKNATRRLLRPRDNESGLREGTIRRAIRTSGSMGSSFIRTIDVIGHFFR